MTVQPIRFKFKVVAQTSLNVERAVVPQVPK